MQEKEKLLKEDPIFEHVSLYKALKTNKGKTILFHNDGSASIILKLKPLNNTAMSEKDFVKLHKKISLILMDLDPEKISVSFCFYRKKASFDVSKVKKLPPYLKPRVEFLNTLAENHELFKNHYYITIHCKKIKESKKSVLKDFFDKHFKNKPIKSQLDKEFDGINERVALLVESVDGLRNGLSTIGIKTYYLKEEQEYYDVMTEFFRPSKHNISQVKIDKKTEELESPRQALFSGVRAEVNKNDFILDNYYHRVYTLDRPPRDLIFGKSLSVIEKAPYEFFFNITFRRMSNDETLKTFQMEFAKAEIMDSSNETSVMKNRQLTANKERISEHYDEFAYNRSNLFGVKASAQFVLRSEMDHLKVLQKRQQCETLDELLSRIDKNLQKGIFSSFGNSDWVNEPFSGWEVFCKIVPGLPEIFGHTLKSKTMLSNDLPYFLPLYNTEMVGKIEHTGTNHFIDEKDNLILFDVMNSSLPAKNYGISGQTGAGKSVLMNTILTMQFTETHGKDKPLICILDVGGDRGSYSKFMELVDGEQINMSAANKPQIQMMEINPELAMPTQFKVQKLMNRLREADLTSLYEVKGDDEVEISDDKLQSLIEAYYIAFLALEKDEKNYHEINEIFNDLFGTDIDDFQEDFTLKLGECKPSEEQMTLIMSLMEVILSKSVQDGQMDGFVAYEEDKISRLVLETYEHIGEKYNRLPRIRDMLEVVDKLWKDDKNGNRADLKSKIHQFTTDGQYPMFDRDSNINIDNPVILADLKGLESNPKLQMMYTLLLSRIFSDKMYYGGDRVKIIVRDEAWSLMKNSTARRFFVEDLRTARKNGFATISISQSPLDYMSPSQEDGEAIIGQMQVQMFGKFDLDSLCEKIGRQFQMPEPMIEELMNLGVQYKEIDGVDVPDYSRFIMKVGKSFYVLKNKLHPFEYLLYSSDPNDNAVIRYYRKKSPDNRMPDLVETLDFLSKGKHKGDKNLYDYLVKANLKTMAKRVKGNRNWD